LSFVAAACFWVVVGVSSRPLEPAHSLVAAAAALGATVGLGAFVTGRWLSDRLSKDEYGTLIIAFDPDESKTQHPYIVMSITGLITATFSIVLAVTGDELPRSLGVLAYGLVFGLAIYCALGSISLVMISRRHQRRASVLRALKEDAAREERRRRRHEPDDPSP